MTSKPFRREFSTLNGIRGVAAIAVVLFHADALVGAVFPRGYLAVDLFFVLSGFVVAHAYGAKLSSTLTLRGFTVVRALRFWPLYILGLTLGVVRELLLIVTHNHYALPLAPLSAAIVLGAAFVPLPLSARGANLFPLNVPSWSLFYELAVNVAYAAARPLLSTAVLTGLIACSAVAFVLMSPAQGIGHLGVTLPTLTGGCVRTLLSFAIGVLVHRVAPRVPRFPALGTMALVAVALAWPWGGRAYDLLFVLVLSPALVTLGTATEPSGRAGRIAQSLGLISFPLYAIHRPLLSIVEAIANRLPEPASAPVLGWVAVAALILLARRVNAFDLWSRRMLSNRLGYPLLRDPTERAAP